MKTANGWFTQYTDQFRPALHGAARVCAVFAHAVLSRLDQVVENTSPRRVRTIAFPVNTVNATNPSAVKTLEVPLGESWLLRHVTCKGSATPYDITIRSGGMLRYAKNSATALFTDGPDAYLSLGAGAPLEITTGGSDSELTLTIEIAEPMHPQHATAAGEAAPPRKTNPAGVVGIEIERHFPGALRGDNPHGGGTPEITQGVKHK